VTPGHGALAVLAGAAAVTVGVVLGDRALYPYAQHRLLDIPLPLLTRRRLDALLLPNPGERILETGLGTGLQALHVAPQLGADGHLAVVDATFAAAYLVTELGEVPRRLAALMELRRVLKPGERLVMGEFADRHHLPLATLVRLANDAGLHLVRRPGAPLAYYALFRPCPRACPDGGA
jgi:ubiquinone/menaquinone biosynthesis C-methylase UbiE